MRRVWIVVGTVVLIVGAGFATFALLQGNGGPSTQEREACAAIQDVYDDAKSDAPAIQGDLQRAGRAANRSDNAKLAAQIAKAREKMAIYVDSPTGSFDPTATVVATAAEICDKIGAHIRAG